MSEVQTVCAAVHEIAHAKLHDYEHMTELADDGETILVPGEKSRNTEEVEAESISYARGNLVRIENALDKMPERLRSVQEQLENLYNQQAAAKAEVGKPFPQEQELAAKTARLIELDMELNLDGKGQPQPEQAIAKSTRPSVLDRLKAPPVHGAPEKPHKKEMEAR